VIERIEAGGSRAELDQARSVKPTPDRVNRTETERPSVVSSQDEVEISAEAVRMQRVREAVEAAPLVRPEVVDRVREAIADGTYKVDSKALARRILDVLA